MKQLDKFPRKQTGRPSSYDFDVIFDGNVWQLQRGDDFDRRTTANAARAYIIQAASRRGVKIQTTVPDKDTVVVQRVAKKG
jgi:hypothetical protein